MDYHFRLMAYGQLHIYRDSTIVIQAVITLGHRHHQQQQRQGQGLVGGQDGRSLRRPGKPAQVEPEVNDTPTVNSGEAADSGGSS